MSQPFKIAILADFKPGYRPHMAMHECFEGLQDSFGFAFEWLPTELLANRADTILSNYNGIIAGSGPYQSKQGIINGIRYARLNNIPFMGTCSGFGYAVLEFGQWFFGLSDVFHPYEYPGLPPGQTFLQPLNSCPTEMVPISFTPVTGTLAADIYKNRTQVQELSHCVYGVNAAMIPDFTAAGFFPSGMDRDNETKIIEYRPNDFFIITLFLPQLNPDGNEPNQLIGRFLHAALNRNTR